MHGYYVLTRITDFGPYVTKLILPMEQEVTEDAVSADCFSVYVERLDENGRVFMAAPIYWHLSVPLTGWMTAQEAFPSQEKAYMWLRLSPA